MKILMLQPNYHSGGAEIAGNWTPSWVAYIGGALKKAGFEQIRFVDAMADDLPDETIEEIIRQNQPDIVMTTNITPSIFKAQDIMKLAKKVNPKIKTIMGGIHSTFMYPQVLSEAPETDYVIRGEGEEVAVNLIKAIAAGTDLKDRENITGIAYINDEGKVHATAAHPVIEDLDDLTPDWSLYDWDKYIYTPLNCRLAVPNFARGCPFTCTFCSQWQFWRRYRARSPKHFVDEIEVLVKKYNVGFFILADEEPTINKQKFVSLCQELIDRDLGVTWGINTRVTDIMRDEDLLPFYRKAGLVHVSLGTEAASQMNLNRFRKETTIEENKYAIKLLQKNGIVAEAQFVMGLEHETPQTIEETYQLCKDWDPDMANWTIYTPWPFSDLFKELGDRVEVRDYSRYNFVSPIIKPDNMEREDVLKGVLKSYGRFYARKTFFSYPWIKDPYVRKYMLGCLKAFAQTTITKRFYDIDRVKTKNRKVEIDLGFDKSRILTQEEVKNLKEKRPEMIADMSFGLKEAGYQREHDEHDWDEFDESTIKDRTSSTVRNC
ncbi:magnesium-protoporphyrin IX monomethyl ester anaerobic oxidative cyclase [Prosthecochloris sp. N3]|uniref:Magnesium-protoporphyrin IX monomethyl ester anaerobic oxidative cyclase n=1 Tax=Prosthecochloris ethylica TaxID=2743976 RepID=A0ABR9XP12_9CHLB|nr:MULTISPECIES: magnesium-protoporphyrin IX monomethyl ester anaerobic oxidative cyclase [Prosthecochloris]MBF0585795.1 magnesium-protoporphyrin IX monomethyl ester anaerobic oxidative cyclase [Prosthecochloris ethylica]MBF0635705.1 magnesium-protoporphyrin IX monomethyl ester anaerobic oxidative cyclase [Prosthecochloris ethylica]NUK47003.1 magnesium-protoporphyrin IX monomethyl ester anaerobic oxidative cyclase [Prosthecochloris ethylica]RNA65487.1 magnesium-protoporphyrin IX monomethyl este